MLHITIKNIIKTADSRATAAENRVGLRDDQVLRTRITLNKIDYPVGTIYLALDFNPDGEVARIDKLLKGLIVEVPHIFIEKVSFCGLSLLRSVGEVDLEGFRGEVPYGIDAVHEARSLRTDFLSEQVVTMHQVGRTDAQNEGEQDADDQHPRADPPGLSLGCLFHFFILLSIFFPY